jgi:hypothetical protein
MQAAFGLGHGVIPPTTGTVSGMVSLVFWSILLVVSVKYMLGHPACWHDHLAQAPVHRYRPAAPPAT